MHVHDINGNLKQKQVVIATPGFELGFLDSKSKVITTTLRGVLNLAQFPGVYILEEKH